MRIKKTGVAAAAALGCVMLAAACGSSSSNSSASGSTNWAKATSVSAGWWHVRPRQGCGERGTPQRHHAAEQLGQLRRNFVPTAIGGPTTVQNGTTPILIWWDYLLASEVKPVVPGFKIVIPKDSTYASYHDQAISVTAPRWPGQRRPGQPGGAGP